MTKREYKEIQRNTDKKEKGFFISQGSKRIEGKTDKTEVLRQKGEMKEMKVILIKKIVFVSTCGSWWIIKAVKGRAKNETNETGYR